MTLGSRRALLRVLGPALLVLAPILAACTPADDDPAPSATAHLGAPSASQPPVPPSASAPPGPKPKIDKAALAYFFKIALGAEYGNDVPVVTRWTKPVVTVRVPGDDPDRVILLEKPGPPAMDAKTAEQVRELIAKGASGFTLGFTTDDARKTYAEFTSKGVELTDGPTEQPYGIDFGGRDPFGNHFRVSQRITG